MNRLLTALEIQQLHVDDDVLLSFDRSLALNRHILPVEKSAAGFHVILPVLPEAEELALFDDLQFALDGEFTYDRAALSDLRDKVDCVYHRIRATVSRCGRFFHFGCPSVWTRLTATVDPNIRFCSICQRDVYYAKDLQELADHAQAGHCTASVFRHLMYVDYSQATPSPSVTGEEPAERIHETV
jgi:hypothetical protein